MVTTGITLAIPSHGRPARNKVAGRLINADSVGERIGPGEWLGLGCNMSCYCIPWRVLHEKRLQICNRGEVPGPILDGEVNDPVIVEIEIIMLIGPDRD